MACVDAARKYASIFMNADVKGYNAKKNPYISTAQQDQLMADLSAVAASHERAITGATHNDGTQAWKWWHQYCKSV